MRYGDTFSYEIHAEEGTENITNPTNSDPDLYRKRHQTLQYF